MARVDLFVARDLSAIWINEINSPMRCSPRVLDVGALIYVAHVLACLPESAASVPCTIGNNPTATLEFVAQDYVAHLKHHLNQIIGKRFETAYGAK